LQTPPGDATSKRSHAPVAQQDRACAGALAADIDRHYQWGPGYARKRAALQSWADFVTGVGFADHKVVPLVRAWCERRNYPHDPKRLPMTHIPVDN
jgi:hypothetical protein